MRVWRNIVIRSALNLRNRILQCRMILPRKFKTSKLKKTKPNEREQWQRNVREGSVRRNFLMSSNLFMMWFHSFHFCRVILSTVRFFNSCSLIFSDSPRDSFLFNLAFFNSEKGEGEVWSDISATGILQWKHLRK